MKKHLLLPFLFLLSSCAGTQPASQSGETKSAGEYPSEKKPDVSNNEPSGGKDMEATENRPQNSEKTNYRMVVSFYSKGEGADGKAIDLFNNYIADYETQNKVKIVLEKVPWGREGEVDYCLPLDNLKFEAQNNFVMQVREILLQSQLVHIAENAACIHKK